VAQFFSVVTHRHDPELDRRLRTVVRNDDQWGMLMRLSPFDRAHHLTVRDRLEAAGYDDPELLLAAALHDVGKADERGRVRLVHRVVKVVLGRCCPAILGRINEPGGSVLKHGLYLALHHPRLGAELVAETGASERCCELIALHHASSAAARDPDLLALIHADEGLVP
jgi:hypothetical protein